MTKEEYYNKRDILAQYHIQFIPQLNHITEISSVTNIMIYHNSGIKTKRSCGWAVKWYTPLSDIWVAEKNLHNPQKSERNSKLRTPCRNKHDCLPPKKKYLPK